MREINWYGNIGLAYPDPKIVENMECGVCGAKMDVKRNVRSATGFAEAMSGRTHEHDSFFCSHVSEHWHRAIVRWKMDVCTAELIHAENYEQIKRVAEKEIRKFLTVYAKQ